MRSPLPWLGALLALYLTVPLVAFVLRAGRGRESLQSTPGLTSAITVSVETATISTLVIAVLGVPLAYVLSRGRGRSSTVVGVLLQLPLAFPPLVSGLLLLYLVGPYTAIGDLFGGRLTDTRAGIVLAQVFVAAPFAVIAARSAFTALDQGWEDVAATLGHGQVARFLKVAVPAAAPGIGAGLMLSWLRAFGEFGATVLLAYQPHSIPVLTYIQFGSTGLTGTTALVLATLAISLAVVAGTPLLARLRWPVHPEPVVPAGPEPKIAPGPRLDLDLDARMGTFHLRLRYPMTGRNLAIIGPSGSGKTMTLRQLAGLLPPGSSRLLFGSVDVTGVRAEHRGVGYVPQEPTLLPHLPVWQQVTFAVGADPQRAAYWLHRLHLDGLQARLPHQLSGGQRRRVAIARALAHGPRLLLLDEPSSGLDTVIRDELRRELRTLQQETRLTTVLVTHDPAEAVLLADEVVVLDHGAVLQAGPISQVYTHPASVPVARLVGIRNVHESEPAPGGHLRIGGMDLRAPEAAETVAWCVRPERIGLGEGADAQILDVIDHGAYREALLDWNGTRLTAHTDAAVRAGDRCAVRIDPQDVVMWPGPARATGASVDSSG